MPPERGLLAVMSVLAVLALLFVPAGESTATFLAVSLLLGVALFTVQPLSQATVAAYSPSELSRHLVRLHLPRDLRGRLARRRPRGAVLTRAGPRELFFVLAGIAALGALSAAAVSGSRPVETDDRDADIYK